MRAEKLKNRLVSGETVIGTFIRSAEPAICEVLALCGFDFVVLDGEHSPLGIRELVDLVRAADSVNLPAIIRVSQNAPFPIMQALDIGASGIQVPQVNSAEEAIKLVSYSKYYPLGNRGFAATHRAALYGFKSPYEYTQEANANTLVVCYIETKEAIDNIEEIAKVEGIDVLFAGPFDLSQSYNVPGQINHPEVQKAIERVVTVCNSFDKAAGTIASNLEEAKNRIKLGFRYLCYSSDLGMLTQIGRSVVRELHS